MRSFAKTKAWAMMITALLIAGTASHAQEQEAASSPALPAMTYAMEKTMNPATWMQLMAMSMDPRIQVNPISSCAACHENEDVGRYQKTFGPSVAMMWNPMMWMNPGAYAAAAAPMMSPMTQQQWMLAWNRRFDLNGYIPVAPGAAPAGGMYWWPWPAAPYPFPQGQMQQMPGQ